MRQTIAHVGSFEEGNSLAGLVASETSAYFPMDQRALDTARAGGGLVLPSEIVGGREDVIFTAGAIGVGPWQAPNSLLYMGNVTAGAEERRSAVMEITFPKDTLARNIVRAVTRRTPAPTAHVKLLELDPALAVAARPEPSGTFALIDERQRGL